MRTSVLPKWVVTDFPDGGGGGGDAPTNSSQKPSQQEGNAGLLARVEAAEKAASDAQTALEAERVSHTAARSEADNARILALKYQVAAEKQVPLHLADRLQGATLQEIEADVEKNWKTIMNPPFTPPFDPSQGKDQGSPRGGTVESGRELYQRLRGKNRTSGRKEESCRS